MGEQANQAEERAPWTIKGMPVVERKRVIACANRAGVSVAEWLVRATRTQETMDRDNVLPPQPEAPPPMPDLADLAGLMQAAQGIAQAAGVPVSKTAARHALALTTAQLRIARGLPPRQTRRQNGQTIDGELTATAGLLAGPGQPE